MQNKIPDISPPWLEKNLKDFSNKCFLELRKDETKTNSIKILYHYTNLNSLNLILLNRNLLFSDFRYLNDSLEFEYGLCLTKTILDELGFHNKEQFLNKLTSLTNNPQSINFYISCFSDIYTNLALWRYYADDGCGVAIGIDSNFALEEEQVEENPILGKVNYGENRFVASLHTLIRRVKTITNCQDFKRLDHAIQKKMELALHSELAVFIITLSILIKHPSFKEEEEIRLFLIDGKYSRMDIHPMGFIYPNERKMNCNSPYNHWNINEDLSIFNDRSNKEKRFLISTPIKKDNFKEIWIGPRCNPHIKDRIVKRIKELGYDTSKMRIEQVNLPYR